MRSHVEETAKCWELRERGILLDAEVIETFVDRADPPSVISDFLELPAGLQKVIRNYFQHGISERLYQFVHFGRSTTTEHDQRVRQRFANIEILLKLFQSELPNQPA